MRGWQKTGAAGEQQVHIPATPFLCISGWMACLSNPFKPTDLVLQTRITCEPCPAPVDTSFQTTNLYEQNIAKTFRLCERITFKPFKLSELSSFSAVQATCIAFIQSVELSFVRGLNGPNELSGFHSLLGLCSTVRTNWVNFIQFVHFVQFVLTRSGTNELNEMECSWRIQIRSIRSIRTDQERYERFERIERISLIVLPVQHGPDEFRYERISFLPVSTN